MIINREELAWAAGFFDGEGHVGFNYIHNQSYTIKLHVTQVHTQPLERFGKAINNLGKIYGPYNQLNRKPKYVYTIGGLLKVQATIALLWNWLSEPKRNQAEQTLQQAIPYYQQAKPDLPKMTDEQTLIILNEVSELYNKHGSLPWGWISYQAKKYKMTSGAMHRKIYGK